MRKLNTLYGAILIVVGLALVIHGMIRLYGIVDVSGLEALFSLHPEDLIWLTIALVPLTLGVLLTVVGVRRLSKS